MRKVRTHPVRDCGPAVAVTRACTQLSAHPLRERLVLSETLTGAGLELTSCARGGCRLSGGVRLNVIGGGSNLPRAAGLALVFCLAGCGSGFVCDILLDGPYRLVAVDLAEDMMLCRSIGTKGDCVGGELPGATIYQAGYNANYIVLARHPRQWPHRANRSVS